jgi:hypothetical protein
MEGHGEAVCLVADSLDQQERRALGRKRDGVVAVPGKEQLFLLGDANGHQARKSELFECAVGSGQLSFATVDQDQIGERTTVFEYLAIAAQDPGSDWSPLIRNFLYSDRFIRPSSQTTIEATVSLP